MSKIHQKRLDDFIVLINRIRFDSFNFLNYYLLRRLASGKNVPDIDQKFVRDCINAATLPGRAIKASSWKPGKKDESDDDDDYDDEAASNSKMKAKPKRKANANLCPNTGLKLDNVKCFPKFVEYTIDFRKSYKCIKSGGLGRTLDDVAKQMLTSIKNHLVLNFNNRLKNLFRLKKDDITDRDEITPQIY